MKKKPSTTMNIWQKRWSHRPTAPFNLGQGLPLGFQQLFLFILLHVSSCLLPVCSGNGLRVSGPDHQAARSLAMSYTAAGGREPTRSGRGRETIFPHGGQTWSLYKWAGCGGGEGGSDQLRGVYGQKPQNSMA